MNKETRPNILYITTDQQRADTVGCFGSKHVPTPYLDALAARGTRFERAYIQSAVCIPSRTCMTTGRYIHQHTVDHMKSKIDDTPPLPEHERTVPELLQTAGYHTAAFGKTHVWPERGWTEKQTCGGKGARWTKSAGLEIGLGPLGRDYAAWLEARHPGGYEAIYEQRRHPDYQKYHTAIRNVLPLEEYVDHWCTDNTIDFIRRDHGKPWFTQCGFCGPHDPMDPPEPYGDLYSYDDVELPPNYAVNLDGSPRETTPEQDAIARRFVAHYWAQVRLIDDEIARIVKTLEETGQFDNTLIVFVSDHGEMLFERGCTAKSRHFDPIIRTPLIVVPPKDAERVPTVSGVIEAFDIAPTILDYARAGIPTNMSASTLRPIIEQGAPTQGHALCQQVAHDQSWKTISLTTGRYRYIWSNTDERPERFFDLVDDPHERTNFLDDPKYTDETARHRKLMIDRLSLTPD